MYIYQVSSTWHDQKECADNYNISYVVHDKEFSKEEFEHMCNEGLEYATNDFELADFLKKNYGFRRLPITQKFEFDED